MKHTISLLCALLLAPLAALQSLSDLRVRGGEAYVSPFRQSETEKVEINEVQITNTLAERSWEQAEIVAHRGTVGLRIAGKPAPGVWLPSEHPLVTMLAGRFGGRPIPWAFTDRESRGLAFAVANKATIPLAKYRDSAGIACAVKEFPKWRSVFMGVPWLEAQFLANLARTAGAWRAGEPHDAVFASQHLITIHALTAGKKTLRPRYPSKVTDAFTGEVIAENAVSFTVDMPFGQTRVFRTEVLSVSGLPEQSSHPTTQQKR